MKDSNIRLSYNTYVREVTTKIENLRAELTLIVNERVALTKTLRAVADKASLNWGFYNKYLKRDDAPTPSIEEVLAIYNPSSSTKLSDVSFEFNYKIVDISLLKIYIEQILNLYWKGHTLENKIRSAENSKIPYYLYFYIIEQYYESVAINLLRGGYYHIKNIGMIKVVVKRTNFADKKVNWGESLALLKEFAYKNHKDIYDKFETREISKIEFIEAMKPYVYDEHTNPNGFKWLVRITNEFSPWLSYSKANCNIDKKYRFGVVPTNYCNTPERSQTAFVKACRKEEDIIYSEKLGFRDKLNALLAFNPNYISNFKLIEKCPT